jgi:hypothetical protein
MTKTPPRAVTDKTAKQQINDKLAAANFKLPKELKPPANDNFKPVVSWPLMDQLTRSTFEPDRERRTTNVVKARYIRELIDIVQGDSLGLSVHLPGKHSTIDYDVQRTESGSVYFEHGQSLDRRKVTINNEDRDERFIGSARTAKNSLPVGGDRFGDTALVRLIAARQELGAIIEYVGPLLWPSLKAVISENATMTDVGMTLGVKRAQASTTGTAVIRLALNGATEALRRFNEVKDVPRCTTPLPVKSRGSFLNQSGGPVVKVAA